MTKTPGASVLPPETHRDAAHLPPCVGKRETSGQVGRNKLPVTCPVGGCRWPGHKPKSSETRSTDKQRGPHLREEV